MRRNTSLKIPLPLFVHKDTLEPYMSRKAVELHRGKHQQDYMDRLNKQLPISPLYGHTLEDPIKEVYNNNNNKPLPKNNDAASVWNHHFFEESMQSEGGGALEAGALQQIKKDFGSFNFREEFTRLALSLLVSGWIWLVLKRSERKLIVVQTRNAINPLT